MTSRSKKRARYKATKKRRFLSELKKHSHNILSVIIVLGILVFAYILFFRLLFDSLFFSKGFGPSDTRELLFLSIVGSIIGVSYLIRHLINYTEEQKWQKNLRLLRDVNFNLDRYVSLKGMGIDHITKRKRKQKPAEPKEKI